MMAALLGGLGVFLLGMTLLTDGLKAVAGDALRRVLTKYVATPVSGVAWGALVTAVVQSSTATTLTTIGFVSAGLLTFTQAIGVIFGANLGTTSTGWIVSQLGFKVSLGAMAPPLVLAGVALRLLGKGRVTHAGTAIGGFALLFMGIDLLQIGMGSLAERVTPDHLPHVGGVWGLRAMLVGIGFLMTVVMLSSSAAMTTTLAAVASGAIGLEHAALLIIGQNIGTTPKAVAASIGSPTPAKRTAVAHVMFNVVTAGVALGILPWLLRACVWAADLVGVPDAPTVLAMFHTAFNVLGVVLLLPLVGPFARVIERMLPERGPRATRYLAPAVAALGPVALEAARRALAHILTDMALVLQTIVNDPRARGRAMAGLDECDAGLREVVKFVHRLGREAQTPSDHAWAQSLLHVTDHAERLGHALRETPEWMGAMGDDPVIDRARTLAMGVVSRLTALREPTSPDSPISDEELARLAVEAAAASRAMADFRKVERRAALRAAAEGREDPDRAMNRVDTLLWFDRVAYHLWRATHHLHTDTADDPPASPQG
jgi:phosphate:Na+ symporter